MLHANSYVPKFNQSGIKTNDPKSNKTCDSQNENTNKWFSMKLYFIKGNVTRLYPMVHNTYQVYMLIPHICLAFVVQTNRGLLAFNHENKSNCSPSCIGFKITTSNGRRMKFCSSVKSICYRIPQLSSKHTLQLIKQDFDPKSSTFNIQSPT